MMGKPIITLLLPEQAVRVFEEITALLEGNRAFYYEWGVAEGECGHQSENVMLAAFSLADQCRARQVDNDSAKRSLAGIGVAFDALYDAYRNPAFRDARMAVAVLGRTLRLDAESIRYFDKHFREAAEQGAVTPEFEQAIQPLQAGIVAAAGIGLDAKSVELLPQAETLTFDGLKELVCYSSQMGGRF